MQYARVETLGGVWPPKGIETFDPWHLPLLNTLILLTSGTTVTWAHHALLEGDRQGVKIGLWLTIMLGLIFSCVQAIEYSHAGFGFKGNIYGATFFMATGFHGAHVIIGTIFLIVCLLRTYRGDFTPKQHLGFEFAAWYWHFVDVVWLFLFAAIYVWGYGGPVAGAALARCHRANPRRGAARSRPFLFPAYTLRDACRLLAEGIAAPDDQAPPSTGSPSRFPSLRSFKDRGPRSYRARPDPHRLEGPMPALRQRAMSLRVF